MQIYIANRPCMELKKRPFLAQELKGVVEDTKLILSVYKRIINANENIKTVTMDDKEIPIEL